MFFQYVRIFCHFVELVSFAHVFLVRHVPAWLPGAGFKRFAQQCRAILYRLRTEPYDETIKKIVSNYVESSLTGFPLN